MKKQVILFSAIIAMIVFVGFGCAGNDKKAENTPVEKVKEEYQCPMKCTEEKFDKAGKCSVCGMDLEKISNG